MATTKKTPVKTPKKAAKKAAPKKAVKAEKVEESLCAKSIENYRFYKQNGQISFQIKQNDQTQYATVHNFTFYGSNISCGVRQMINLPKGSFFEGTLFNNKLSVDERIEKFAKEFLECLKSKAKDERFTFVVASDYKNEANLFMDKISAVSSSFSKNRNSNNQIKVWTIKI